MSNKQGTKKCRYEQAIQIQRINGTLTVIKSSGCRCGWKSQNITDNYELQKKDWTNHKANLHHPNTQQTMAN